MENFITLLFLSFIIAAPISASIDCPNSSKKATKEKRSSGERRKRSDDSKSNSDGNGETNQEPAMGRPIQLGALYYAREDRVSINENLWSQETLKTKATVVKKPSSKTQLALTQTSSDRAKLFGMGLRLKVTVFFTWVNSETKKLSVKRSRKSSVSLSLTYEAINKVESISQDLRSKLDFPEICLDIMGQEDGPTHVITSVTR